MNIFNDLKNKISIVDVISEYTSLKRSGSYFKGLCPIHQEKTPSLYVTPHKGIFYCFSCRAGGDGITFVAHMERCSQLEAARHLAERYQIPLALSEQTQAHTTASWSQQQRHTALCTLIADFCHKQLLSHHKSAAYDYLQTRGISSTSIEQFVIGYLPGGESVRRQLLNAIKQKNFIADDLISIKFMLRGTRALYSPFEERIIFPIHDHMGRISAFGGRTFQPHDSERPKYYNSHENPFFSKSKLLYGFDSAKRHLHKASTLYIAEGYLDCIAMVQAGISNTVATLGTACTAEHMTLIARYTPTITVVYDGDQAGLNATMRLSELCWQHEIDIFVTELPDGEDPASYLANPANRWETLVRRDIFEFYIHALHGQLGPEATLATKLEALRTILERVKRIADPLKQHIIMQHVAAISKIPIATLAREITPSGPAPQPQQTVAPKTQKEINKFAKSLFCAMLNREKKYSQNDQQMIATILPLRLKILFEKLTHYQETHSPYIFSDFFALLAAPEQAYVAQLLLTYEPENQPSLDQLLEQCRTRAWKLLAQEFQNKISAAQHANNYALLATLMHEFNELKKSILNKGTL